MTQNAVDRWIEEAASVESMAAYAHEFAADFDLDAVSADFEAWLETKRDAIAAALPREEWEGGGVVFHAIGGEPVLISMFQAHDKA